MTQYDYICFGATGFTGQYVLEELFKQVAGKGKIAAAGRSETKLKAVLKSIADRTNDQSVLDTPIMIADVKDLESMELMAKSARCVLNCVGPFRFFGEPVVKACVNNGTHYVDITGEPEFMENMLLKYDEAARKNKCLIVSACGFDSIPADLGCEYAIRQFPDRSLVSKVESFYYFRSETSGKANYATWESAVHGFAHQRQLKEVRKKLKLRAEAQGRGGQLPTVGPRPTMYGGLSSWNDALKTYCLPFPGSDTSVVRRTQRFFYENAGQHPAQFSANICVQTTFYFVMIMVIGVLFGFLAQFSFGRKLLLKYPGFFSNGFFDREGPTQEQLDGSSFEIRFVAHAYASHEEKENHNRIPPSKRIVSRIHGPEPGYVATPIMVVAAAVSLVKDGKDRAMRGNGLDLTGGVCTPAAALYHDKFLNRMKTRGVILERCNDTA
eukprot:CFRG4965T1